MTLPDRNNPYTFDEFLKRRDRFDYYRDDTFLQRVVQHFTGDEWPVLHEQLLEFSPRPSFRWRDLAEINSLPDNRPRLTHFDGHGHRIDRIERPQETIEIERGVFGEGLFSDQTSLWERLSKQLLIHQNGEHGVSCAMTCTEGLVALVGAHVETAHPAAKEIWRHCKEGFDGDFGTGSQFLTEIQGGSDVPANRVEAVPDSDGQHFRLYGTKFFCSACHTDYAIVTAKVTGSSDVSTFLVPAWLPGNKDREIRNGYRINRLKRKLGTIELPTGEIEFDGALAYPIGPLGRGVANVVGHVLTVSRLSVSISNTASNIRAVREARMYMEFREVFGQRLIDYPINSGQIAELERRSQATLCGLYKIYGQLIGQGGRLTAGLPRDEDLDARRHKFRLRLLIMLQKLATTSDTVDILHRCISVFAGHGVMECFSAIPRLLRDALINEQWEGPRNMLLAQIHGDLGRVQDWYPTDELVADLLPGAEPEHQQAWAAQLGDIVNADLSTGSNRQTVALAMAWDGLAQDIFNHYQAEALAEVG